MKNLIIFIMLFIFSTALFGCNTQNSAATDDLARVKLLGKIKVGVKVDSKPFGFLDKNGENRGFDVDVAHEVAKRILGDENAVEFITITPQSRISDLNSKKIDMIIAIMTKTESRATVVNFSDPYFLAGQAIMVKKNSKITNGKDLNGENVGFVLGTTGERALRQLAPNANLRAAKTYTEIYNLLKKGEISAILADDSVLYGFLQDDPSVKILQKRYTKEQYAIALRKTKESERLLAAVNSALLEMAQDGTLNKIKNSWIPDLHTQK